MWPMLLTMTRDECRRTLRRLELEAYSNIIGVFRAQGALEENRKKLLEELRAVLHISNDRHSAEARRVANDEILATIAEHVYGPNTGLGWISEGRRLVPLMPRGIPQTAYTDIADKAAENAREENKQIKQRLEEKLVAPKSSEEEIPEAEGETAESALHASALDELTYIAMEDQANKIWEAELAASRKRKMPDGGAVPDDVAPPVKNIRNIPVNTGQRHLNLSQIYSKFSQPVTSKASGQSKHSYNQGGKISTSKPYDSHSRAPHKPRQRKQNAKASTKTPKKPPEIPISPTKYNPVEYSAPPGSFQATYAQSVLGSTCKLKPAGYVDDLTPKVVASQDLVTDSPTMQLLTQPATVPHEIGVSDNAHPEDPSTLQAQSTPVSGKPCHIIIKKRSDFSDTKGQTPEIKLLPKGSENIKVLSTKQIVVAPSPAQKSSNKPKIVSSKLISSVPKPHNQTPAAEKTIILSKIPTEQKPPVKVIVTSPTSTPAKEIIKEVTSVVTSTPFKTSEPLTPKGIPATDLKVSANKTFVLNKSGQKMVVLPAISRPNVSTEGQLPLVHVKSLRTTMKLLPGSSQVSRSSTSATAPKPIIVSAVSSPKIVGIEPIKTANMADIVPVKGLTPATPKVNTPIIRSTTAKGNVIVLQKSAMNKSLTFTKNNSEMSKIIMGKNVNQLLQAKPDQAEAAKAGGNVIVLELNNDQEGQATTMSEILDNRSISGSQLPDENKIDQQITEETPVLFDNQIVETCNVGSLDSTAESIAEIETTTVHTTEIIEEDGKTELMRKDTETVKDSSSVTDWEIELETVRKAKDEEDKLNSCHLDLGMSSEDSDTEYIVGNMHKTKSKESEQESIPRTTPSGESTEMYSGSSGMSLATRTLLSQLQDDGSSSNDSSFMLKSKPGDKPKDAEKLDKHETDALLKAREKLSEKVADANSRKKRIDIFSTAITPDINLDTFSYLEEGMMAGDDDYEEKREVARKEIEEQLSRYLAEDSTTSTESQTVSETLSK